jgi:hypothetical protein
MRAALPKTFALEEHADDTTNPGPSSPRKRLVKSPSE